MYKNIIFAVAFCMCLCSSVSAEEIDLSETEKPVDPLVSSWKNDALPFFKGIADSFKVDVLDKTSAWFEKTKSSKETNQSFYNMIHKLFIGKDNNNDNK
ncbi:MAG: hypothetical protein PHW52_02235 [Candidatus Pacebacteria bacterium]|nr:hypothetical protein [Candidatus Paceibacterota bacterium]